MMTAHIVYQAIDPELAGTISPEVIQEIIRAELEFDGLIMSDDLNKHALDGSPRERTAACLGTGLDKALQCSGDMQDMKEAAKAVYTLSGASLIRAKAAEKPAVPAPKSFSALGATDKLAAIVDQLTRHRAQNPTGLRGTP